MKENEVQEFIHEHNIVDHLILTTAECSLCAGGEKEKERVREEEIRLCGCTVRSFLKNNLDIYILDNFWPVNYKIS